MWSIVVSIVEETNVALLDIDVFVELTIVELTEVDVVV